MFTSPSTLENGLQATTSVRLPSQAAEPSPPGCLGAGCTRPLLAEDEPRPQLNVRGKVPRRGVHRGCGGARELTPHSLAHLLAGPVSLCQPPRLETDLAPRLGAQCAHGASGHRGPGTGSRPRSVATAATSQILVKERWQFRCAYEPRLHEVAVYSRCGKSIFKSNVSG